MCCKHFIIFLIVRQVYPAITPSAFIVFVPHLNENNASALCGCVVGSILGMNDHRMTSKHSNAFQHSVLCMSTLQHPMLDLKEGLQLPCICEQQDLVVIHVVDLDLASKHCWKRNCLNV